MPPSIAGNEIEWGEVHLRLRRLFIGLSNGAAPTEIDDLVQEACVRLLRINRREEIRELEALLATVARRTWYDHLRRVVRARERFQDMDDQEYGPVDPASIWKAELGDPAERLALAVQELFVGREAGECLELLRHFLRTTGWQKLAEDQGVAHTTLRKRWSRCLALARTEISKDEILSFWLD